jgi:hypothetical protein
MDYIKNHRPKEYGPFRLERWENYITEILHLIVENDATLEVFVQQSLRSELAVVKSTSWAVWAGADKWAYDLAPFSNSKSSGFTRSKNSYSFSAAIMIAS